MMMFFNQELMHEYNNSRHRSIKIKPVEVNKSNKFKVWMNLYSKDVKTTEPKLTSGDGENYKS